MQKKAYIIISDGAEDIEHVVVADILNRADFLVKVISLQEQPYVSLLKGTKVIADEVLSHQHVSNLPDLLVLIGGQKHPELMCSNKILGDLLRSQENSGNIIGAICRAPLALLSHKIGFNKSITSHPLAKDVLRKSGKYNYIDNQKVVLDPNIITSTGPAPAIDFALALVKDFLSADDYDKLLDVLQYKD